jgi:2-polyprenyl-3-methyl-5-hydroxy-6-metoxy-1,4-benzoquinol methylase
MNCRVCDSANLELALDLGRQPWCNHFLQPSEVGQEPYYPLRVVFCHTCRTAQLDYTIPKAVMFSNHTYLSGVTRSLNDHFRGVAAEVDERFFRDAPGKSVMDIGSNDGTQLKHFQRLGYDVLGIEPAKRIAALAQAAGIPTVNDYFNQELVSRLGRQFHVINAAGVFFHLEELHSAAEGIRAALREDGVFVVQFLYMRRILENLAFDQIYHEHLLYYNLQTIEALLSRHGLALFDAYLAPIHGGSIIGFVAHAGRRPRAARLEALWQQENDAHSNEFATYASFARRIEQMKTANLAYLAQAKGQGKRIFGFGAPAKGNTLLNYFKIGPETLDCLVEKNTLRKGLFSPGMHLPIVMEDALLAPPDIYYVLAWNFRNEILANNQSLLERGVEFYFPVNPLA